MLITKADGTLEEFKPSKLKRSLRNVGANKDEINNIVEEVEVSLYDGVSTKDIYQKAFSLLRKSKAPVVAGRYSLRRAVMELGPTGFPFEIFLARLFEAQGYHTKVGTIIPGKCAVHEIDLAAYKADHAFVAEAKFHVRPGIKSDLQVALYSYARLLDLSELKICSEDICGIKNLKIITNTKFTSAASKYAKCVGVELLSWDYPKEENLFSMIEKYNMYPLTVLQTINNNQKIALLNQGLVVCDDLIKRPTALSVLNLSAEKLKALLFEVRQLSVKK